MGAFKILVRTFMHIYFDLPNWERAHYCDITKYTCKEVPCVVFCHVFGSSTCLCLLFSGSYRGQPNYFCRSAKSLSLFSPLQLWFLFLVMARLRQPLGLVIILKDRYENKNWVHVIHLLFHRHGSSPQELKVLDEWRYWAQADLWIYQFCCLVPLIGYGVVREV